MPAGDLPTTVVVDASVAVRWVVPERGSDAAAALLEEPRTWLAPRLLMTEVASALRRKVAGHELTAPVAMGALAAIVDAPYFDTKKRIDAVFFTVLTRAPTTEEAEKFNSYVERGGPSGDKAQALADVYWVLLNSTEFLFNH